MAATSVGSSTSLLDQGNQLAAGGPMTMPDSGGAGGAGLTTALGMAGGPVGAAIGVGIQGVENSYESLKGMIGLRNFMRSGSSLHMDPQDVLAQGEALGSQAFSVHDSVPIIGDIIKSFGAKMGRRAAEKRATEISEAQRDQAEKEKINRNEFALINGQTGYNSIFG